MFLKQENLRCATTVSIDSMFISSTNRLIQVNILINARRENQQSNDQYSINKNIHDE